MRTILCALFCFTALSFLSIRSPQALADGIIKGPQTYEGSLAETSQEAILILNPSSPEGMVVEDMILKITAESDAPLDDFAWIIPLPSEPLLMEPAENELFKELFDYVQMRLQDERARQPPPKFGKFGGGMGGMGGGVEVLQQQVVGSYDATVVKETEPGALNEWLQEEGYQTVDFEAVSNGTEIIETYRKHDFVFVCLKVREVAMDQENQSTIHPIHLRFVTRGKDCLYFPMRLTGVQDEPFDVNLYVFSEQPLNEQKERYGYNAFEFEKHYADSDYENWMQGRPVLYSSPHDDPRLHRYDHIFDCSSELLNEIRPGARYWLTNIRAQELDPEVVRNWRLDLWLTPRYADPTTPPIDLLEGGFVNILNMETID